MTTVKRSTYQVEFQPRDLIVTIYGLYAREEHDWLSVASLIRLMAELDVDAQAVRSSVSRLKRRGTLRSLVVEGAAGYALSPASLAALREGDARIFRQQRSSIADGWVVAAFSVPESEREKRHELRTRLTRLGFGTVAPGVWVAPADLADETAEVLTRRGLEGYVDLFRGDHLGFGADPDARALARKVREWWDLDELSTQYADFTAAFRPVARRVARRRPAAAARGAARDADASAYAAYLPMLTSWRRLPYLDPGLPLDLLPSNWTGRTAHALFHELNAALREPAHRHAQSVIHS